MKEKHVYICENSTTGIFTGIYDAWAARYGHANNRLLVEEPENFELFTKFIKVEPDFWKAEKVKQSIRQKISDDAYMAVYNGSISKDKAKADVIYRFLILGFAMGKNVMGYLSNPYVNHLFKMEQNVKNELFHYEGFLRFVKMTNHILLAKFRPENDVIFSVAEHFADRLPEEDWIIYDERRVKAAVHQAGGKWIAVENFQLQLQEDINQLEESDEFLSLWKRFVEAIGIQERSNKSLELNMLPNRFREFMPEMEYKEQRKHK